jgi:sirohydrochlorin cobaltochelatase
LTPKEQGTDEEEKSMEAPRLVLMAHGSRDPRWCAPFERFVSTLQADLGAHRVRLAYMEFVPPTLADIAAEAMRDGVQHLQILPMFMAGGAHVDQDIPAQVASIKACFPALALTVLPPIGEHPRVVTLMQDIIKAHA